MPEGQAQGQGRSRLAAVAAYAAIPLLCLALAAWQQRVGRWYRAESFIALAVAAPTITTLIRHPRTRWLLPGLAPLLAATALGLNWMHPQAAIAATAGLLALTLLAAGIDVAHHLDRATTAIGHALATIAGTLIFVLTILPAWLWTRLRRHHPLTPTPGWHPTTTDDLDPTALGTTPTRTRSRTTPTRRTWTGRLTWSIGCLTLLLATNYGAGWTWDRAFPTSAPTTIPKDDDGRPRDPRNDSPAMAAYPWRERYFRDITQTPGGYWPFTESRPEDFTSPYVNLHGWVRDSYQPAGGGERPIVWMFGGSTTWGEGQRDDYTIASWISRYAEEDGLPIEPVNYGERGWTHFQEMILFEQQLELAPKPTMAIFYDGANEASSQSLLTEAVPTHVLAYTYAQRLQGSTIASSLVEGTEEDVIDQVTAAYRRHSAVDKLVEWFRGPPAEAMGWQADPTSPAPGLGFQGGQTQAADGGVYDYHVTDQDGIDAGRIYQRGQALSLDIAERHDVDTLFIWQPVPYLEGAYQKAREQLRSPTVDMSDLLKDRRSGPESVFIDGVHTNEEGARIVGEAIWKELRPTIQAWYDARS